MEVVGFCTGGWIETPGFKNGPLKGAPIGAVPIMTGGATAAGWPIPKGMLLMGCFSTLFDFFLSFLLFLFLSRDRSLEEEDEDDCELPEELDLDEEDDLSLLSLLDFYLFYFLRSFLDFSRYFSFSFLLFFFLSFYFWVDLDLSF